MIKLIVVNDQKIDEGGQIFGGKIKNSREENFTVEHLKIDDGGQIFWGKIKIAGRKISLWNI